MVRNETDRRVRRTRAQLQKALLELLEEKDIRAITVQELARRADVNRGTFYAHYTDVYDLLDQMEDQLFLDFAAMLGTYTPQQLQGDLSALLTDVFRFIRDNQALTLVFLSPQTEDAFFHRLNALVYQKCLEEWQGLYPVAPPDTPNYCLDFVVSGAVGLARTWMRREFRESPEEMAALAGRLILTGVSSLA